MQLVHNTRTSLVAVTAMPNSLHPQKMLLLVEHKMELGITFLWPQNSQEVLLMQVDLTVAQDLAQLNNTA